MKTNSKKLIFTITIALFLCQFSQAQFLKKLKRKAKQTVEKVVINKTADKASQITSSGLDKVFNMDLSGQVDPDILPSSYDFTWKYTLEMKHRQGDMRLNYYLKPGAKYFGSQPELQGNTMANGMFMVMDQELEVMTIFMESKNGKSGQVVKSPTTDTEDVVNENISKTDDYSFTKIETKTILGYECQGFKMDNNEFTMTMYFALDAPVSFNQVYGGMQTQNIPKDFDPKWLEKVENSIMMEMQMTHKKKKKYNITMNCVALEKTTKTITINDYEFMKLNTETKN